MGLYHLLVAIFICSLCQQSIASHKLDPPSLNDEFYDSNDKLLKTDNSNHLLSINDEFYDSNDMLAVTDAKADNSNHIPSEFHQAGHQSPVPSIKSDINLQAEIRRHLEPDYYQHFVKHMIDIIRKESHSINGDIITFPIFIQKSEIQRLEELVDDVNQLDTVDEVMINILNRTRPELSLQTHWLKDFIEPETILLCIMATSYVAIVIWCRHNYSSLIAWIFLFTIAVSWIWEWIRLYQATLADQLQKSHLQKECQIHRQAKLNQSSINSLLMYIHQSMFVPDDPCANDIKNTMRNALAEVTPLRVIYKYSAYMTL